MSSDIQTLEKDSLDKSRPIGGKFYPSVYLFTPSLTDKMLCNALLVLKENPTLTISSVPDSIIRSLHASNSTASSNQEPPAPPTITGEASFGSSNPSIASSTITAEDSFGPPTPTITSTNVTEASTYLNYNGGMFSTNYGDVIVRDIKYKLPVDVFEFFEGIFIHMNFSLNRI